MLESNPSRNSQLGNSIRMMRRGGGPLWSSPSIIRIDFPMPLKLIKKMLRSVHKAQTGWWFRLKQELFLCRIHHPVRSEWMLRDIY